MKYFIARFVCAFLGLALLAGCASTDSGNASGNSSTHVPLLFSPPAKAYTEIGTVSVQKDQPAGTTWQNAMQRQAAGRGADAVLVDTSTLDNNNSVVISGKAIQYKK